MKTQSADTSPEAEAFYIEGLRRMTGEERLMRAFHLTEASAWERFGSTGRR